MGPATIEDTYRTFEKLCRQIFQFLIADFGFSTVSVERGPINVGIHITYQNPTTAVEVGFEPTENLILVYLIKLQNGRMPDYPVKYPMNSFYLDELIALRSPSSRVEQKKSGRVFSARDLEKILMQYADILRQVGVDVLRGDFRVFSQLERKRKSGKSVPRSEGTR